jgi:hypothetical protein
LIGRAYLLTERRLRSEETPSEELVDNGNCFATDAVASIEGPSTVQRDR